MAVIKRASIKGGSNASLRMSLPGYDVDTAALNQMAFDARVRKYGKIHASCLARTPVLSTGNPGVVTISFGRTFSKVPLVIAMSTFGDPIAIPSNRWQGDNFDIVWNTASNTPQNYTYLAVSLSAMQLVTYSDFGSWGYAVHRVQARGLASMLVVFDTKGEIEQVITLGDNDEMERAYKSEGKQTYRRRQDRGCFKSVDEQRGVDVSPNRHHRAVHA